MKTHKAQLSFIDHCHETLQQANSQNVSISRDQPRCFEFQFVHISTSRCTFLQFFRRSEIRSIKTKNRNCPSACTRKARTISLTTRRRVFCRRRTTTAEDFTCLKEIRRCKPKKKKNPYLAQTNRPNQNQISNHQIPNKSSPIILLHLPNRPLDFPRPREHPF